MTSHRRTAPGKAPRATARTGGRTPGRLGAAVRGVLALLVLAALLAGIPVALLALGADPFTVRLPSLGRTRQVLASPDDGTLLLGALRVVAWAAWAVLAVSVIVETAAAVVGRAAPALRGLGAVQQPAAHLIATVAAALATSTAAAAAPAAQTAAHAAAVPGPTLGPAHNALHRSDPRPSLPSSAAAEAPTSVLGWGPAHGDPATRSTRARRLPAVQVGRYDSLWRIAERHLGDGHRWSEIYRLNTDRTQPDGERLSDPDIIIEGWTLLLPADATGISTSAADRTGAADRDGPLADSTGGGRHTGRVVIVRAGDTLSGLAERHLGTVESTNALYEANTGRLQPDGGRLTDPDLLRPGWRLVLPTPDQAGPAAPPPTPAHRPPPHRPVSPPTAPVPRVPTPTPTKPAPTTAAPTTTAPATAAPSSTVPASSVPASSAPAGPADTPSVARPATPPLTSTTPSAPSASPVPSAGQADRGLGSWVRLPSGSVLSLGLAATIAGLLALVRGRRRQHRIPGDPSTGSPPQPPQPPLPAAAEAIESAWLATRRRAQDAADDDEVLDVTEDLPGVDGHDDKGSLGRKEVPRSDVLGRGALDSGVLASGRNADLGLSDDTVGEHVDPADGLLASTDLDEDVDEDLDEGGGGDVGHVPSLFGTASGAIPADSASVDSGEAVTLSRGRTAGGDAAPLLLALTGPPTAAVLAEAAWFGGVGLVGAGAAGAARAVLARLLTGSGPMGGVLFTTEETVAGLLPAGAVEGFSVIPGVTVFATLAAALTAAEAELLGRSRRLDDAGADTLSQYRQLPDGEPVPAVLLLAHAPPTPGPAARAAAVLNLGRDRELGAVWLGAWPPATITVTSTGALIGPNAGTGTGAAANMDAHTDRDAGAVLGQAENLVPADAADLLAALLPGVRDALDVLDPTTLGAAIGDVAAGTSTTAAATAAVAAEVAADAEAADPAGLPATGHVDRRGLSGGAVLDVAVLGRVQVTDVGGREVTGLRAKVRELLALLAVHPDGLSTDQISDALWPDAAPGRASNRLSPILAQTRRLLREAAHLSHEPAEPAAETGRDAGGQRAAPVDLVPLTDGRYRLHPVLLDTDYRRFTGALRTAADARAADARQGTGSGDTGYRAALQAAAQLYRGEPFDGAGYGWAEPIREALRRQATDTLAALAESLTPDNEGASSGQGPDTEPGSHPEAAPDPARALTALEQAIDVDPYNEELYRRIMRLHAAAGRRDAVRRTLRLLEARLIDLDTDPDPATLTLATDLLRPRPTRTAGRRDGGKTRA